MARLAVRAVPLLILGMTASVRPAHASLGGDAASIEQDRAALGASQTASTPATTVKRAAANGSAFAYTVHKLTTPAGVTVSEYLDASGAVFAIAWSGPVLPDLRQLLGDYFPTYSDALANLVATRRTRGPVTVDMDGLVVQSSGRMRFFSGIAYLKDKLPAGISAADIR
ncbi:DUF2844 domain-containing protein [Chitinasiproducens palmae]|uniref:DUF2844 domain-containing protein n=1 Tax=Chitinasiproducens palmae TaxID=1770053 RepID=A0A1H2PQC5_9BURK|nr:DUF2844 domain-containing protein [Chitinasiproducens palmae]SDV48571.1 Protein of unknown function [Chitinasiproducens palmae]